MNAFRRAFSVTIQPFLKKTKFPPRPKINEDEITEVFIKGGGKGGQKINKTNSKVQLKHIPTGIVVDSQFSRSREDNRKRAREILALKLDEMTNGETSRAAIVAQYHIQKARKKKQKARKRQRERELVKTELSNADDVDSTGMKCMIEEDSDGESTGVNNTVARNIAKHADANSTVANRIDAHNAEKTKSDSS